MVEWMSTMNKTGFDAQDQAKGEEKKLKHFMLLAKFDFPQSSPQFVLLLQLI